MSVTGRDRIGGSCSASTAQDGTGRKGIARQLRISIVKWKNVTDFVRSPYVYFAVLNTVCITVCNTYMYLTYLLRLVILNETARNKSGGAGSLSDRLGIG